MHSIQQTVSPVDGRVYVERPQATIAEIDAVVDFARRAKADWKRVPLEERAACCRRFVAHMLAMKAEIGTELAWQMGRPVRYGFREIEGMAERAGYMIGIAGEALTDIALEPLPGFTRFIRREPLGVVFAIVPWNYPYLTAVNSVIPAIMAGNVVILKHSPQTPLCAERLAQAFDAAGLPPGVFQYLHMSVEETQRLLRSPEVDFVAFTGSVATGRAVQQAVQDRFIGVGLELGGKDAAYVRPDADLAHAAENIVDGAFFNSGQSCCAIERVYVHEDVYDRFVAQAVGVTNAYVLGSPLEAETTLGPLVHTAAADFVRGQVAEAVGQGAHALIDTSAFPASCAGTPYLAPQILVNVDHSMRVMLEESFGPVVGIIKVASDEEAVRLMNDSVFGLTASVWTTDADTALTLGEQVEVGTWFMNRCDYLDPALAWTGVKQSGRGCSLSRIGYEHLTRPRSFHLRTTL
ncbi:MAG: aldehyde dehydrogenase [Chthonomonadaceae bacterium]|nr:aldehyde dehydrogenase [Chthonomonadaceae bacterium]